MTSTASSGPDLLHDGLPSLEVTAGPLTERLQAATDPTGSLALLVTSDGWSATPEVTHVLTLLGLTEADVAEAVDPVAGVGTVRTLPLPGSESVRALHLVGVGSGMPEELRRAGAGLSRAIRSGGLLITPAPPGGAAAQNAWVEGLLLARYTPPRWTGRGETVPGETGPEKAGHDEPDARPGIRAIEIVDGDEAVCMRAAIRCRAQAIARNLANTPSNIKNPAWLADRAKVLAKRSGVKASVHDLDQLRKLGFGGLLAVGAGSATPPRLVELAYHPSSATAAGQGRQSRRPQHIVLVGKGITFDSGGLDIKPAEGMLGMKTDMSGAAVVLAVLSACRELGVRARVTGLLPLAENAVSGSSMRPSDVLTMYGGRTVEVLNTDAEGRLVLADALAYADATLAPDVVIDVATLTGAMTIALGRTLAGYFVTDEVLRGALEEAAAATGEQLWEFPLTAEYRPALDTPMADLANMATSPVGGGAITAALFLREFTGGRPWAHLDIAGAGRSTVDAGITAKGATAFGVRLLLAYLASL